MLSLVPVSATILPLWLVRLSRLASCLPSALPTLRPSLFTLAVLLTLLVALITALRPSKVRRRLQLSLVVCLLLDSRVELVLTTCRVMLELAAASITLVRELLTSLLTVLLVLVVL
jgi:hypothetical protein